MQPGDVLADRFELESVAGEGGMGAVWRARDRRTGADVALKVMLQHNQDAERFVREAELLARLDHDAIVRYVAHGSTPHGLLYLVMEWVEGVDLADRIARGPLTAKETLGLGVRIGAALHEAHASGVLHRDVKPANVLVPGGDLGRAKLIDFGIARANAVTSTLTRTGAAVGTIGYMAPEQARGAREIDARADVFSLGCVLFECLTGAPAFVGEHWVAVLAKVLLHEPPRLRDVLPGVPAALDDLVARMLSKEPDARPRDGGAVARTLRAIQPSASLVPAPSAPTLAPGSLSHAELGIVSLVLIGRPDLAAAPTLTPLRVAEDEAALKAEAARFSGRVELLADGSVVASFAGDGVASDLAARAVRCALALRALLPDRSAVVATGHAALGHGLPVGDVIDRAARLLRAPAATTIELDEVTRSLVGSRFDVREGAFVGERNEADGGSTVLGRAVPFVGREREIAALTGLLDECVGEPIARAAVVVAAPGAGKSRLVAEVTRAIRTRWPAAQVWTGRGDATTTDSPLSVLRDALRRSDGRFRDLLLAPVEAATAEVRAARGDAHALSEQMRRAFQECVQGACRAAPLVLVLEDLQWSDGASVDFVHSTLKVAAKEPFMVLATGRPELWARFPKLWEEALAMRVDLTPLSKKSSEKLARAMLPEASADVVARLARQSEGNPLFLEEVARAEAEGRARAIPGSVVAMVHARIERLAPKLRLVLRAASVFGRTFWRGGVRELVGDEIDAQEIDRCLDELVRRELVLEVDECAFAGDRQYVFHQDLTREAAYRTLTDEDRALGHKLAGDWLEGAGETNALVLAAHFEKGHELARAVGAYHAAATQALEAEDLEAALDLADKGIASGATGEARGMLRLLQGECHWWRGTDARAALTSAIAELPRRSPSWARAVVRLAMHEGRNDAVDAIATMARDLVAASALLDATWGGALLMLAVQLLVVAPGDAAELAACAIELSTDARKNPRDAFDASRPLAEGDIETLVRLGWAEALDENGDRDAARAVIEAARHRVLERAAEIRDELLRERFLLTPENARTLELAKAWASPE